MNKAITDIQSFRSRYIYDPQRDLILSEKALSVYKATDSETGKIVVIQLFRGPGLGPENFLGESEKVLHYHHPNLASHLAFWVIRAQNFFGEEDFSLVSVHEYVPGHSLRHHMDHPAELKAQLDTVLLGILYGLQYLHNQGFPHGSLNPDNIILEENSGILTPRLINYGYSKLFQAKKTSSGNILLATGQYMPPEKIISRSSGNFTGSTDLWALGVILYEIMLGRSPFGSQREGHTLAYIFDKILNAHIFQDGIPPVEAPYLSIITSCLDKDPLKRAHSAEQIQHLLLPEAEISEETHPENTPRADTHIARVIFLGNDADTRAKLIRHLAGSQAAKSDEKTGIAVSPHHFVLDGKNIRANCWDFTNEEMIHLTYRFFLSPRCVYVLVMQQETDDYQPDRDDWMKVIHTLGNGSSVIFIQSEEWKDTPAEIQKFVAAVEKHVGQLEHIVAPLPANFLAVQTELSTIDEDFIDYGEFRKICRKHKLDTEEQDKLSLFLHEQGLVLHFRDEATLRGISILRPEWITKGVAAIMNSPLVEQQKGLLSVEELSEILDQSRYPSEKHFILPELMFKFQLCFPIGERRMYFLIPERLPLEKPEYFWKTADNLRFRYQYEFLPKSLFPRFIVKTRKYTEGDKVWRNGIILFEGETRAEIICLPGEKLIEIRTTGDAAQSLLKIIRNKFSEVHQTYGNMTIREGVPCPCEVCSKDSNPFYHNYEEVQEYRANGLSKKVCSKSFKMVSVAELLAEPERKPNSPPFLNEPEETEKENTYLGYVAKNLRRSQARTILFLAANPSETAHLQLARECREIDNGLARASHRLEFKLEQKWAVTPRDFRRALMNFKPEFVHFSGHGTHLGKTAGGADSRSFDWEENPLGGLVFEDESGNGKGNIVSSEALKSLFGLFPDIKCVLLNACYSKAQAEAISIHTPYVIGMKRPITDNAAIAFAVSFYDAIGANESVEFAFKYACTAIELEGQEGADIPVLLKKGK
ncbi:MAG: COR domain-containing protein [Bacteroidia bacterium]